MGFKTGTERLRGVVSDFNSEVGRGWVRVPLAHVPRDGKPSPETFRSDARGKDIFFAVEMSEVTRSPRDPARHLREGERVEFRPELGQDGNHTARDVHVQRAKRSRR